MGFRDRFRGRTAAPRPDAATTSSTSSTGVIDEDLLDAARLAVLPGFLTLGDAVEQVREVCERDEGDPEPERAVRHIWTRREAEQATWEGRSDYDRLRAAFDNLQDQGVVARMNFTCCTSCGTEEIDAERTPLEGAGYPYRESSYTFFHQQDAERLAEEPATLYLAYSCWRPSPDLDPSLAAAAKAGDKNARDEIYAHVGRRVAEAVRAEGLEVVWDGSASQRIAVTITRWRKPLPA